MADFNFYLNRQGVRGRKGDKGDQGFSPVITEYDTGNPLEYVLRIQTEDGVMYTRNLRPEFTNNGGTYLRFNQSNNTYRIDVADYATTSSQGEVRLANSGDVVALTSTTTAVTPKDVDTILTNKGYATSISNLQSDVSGLSGDLTSLSGTVTNLSGTVGSLSNTVTSNYNNTVKLSGNQTIAGNKTFTGSICTNTVSTQDGLKTMIDYNSSSNSMRIGGASTSNVYLRTSSSGKLIHAKDGTGYEVYDTSNLIAGSNISINSGVISATDTTYTAGRGIDITNGEVSISDSISADPITGVALLSDGILRVKTGEYQIGVSDNRYRNVAKFELTDNNSDGIIFGDLNCVTSIKTAWNAVNILRKDSNDALQTYINIDSGNISDYVPVSYISEGLGIDIIRDGSYNSISVDNTMVVTTYGDQDIRGVKKFGEVIETPEIKTDTVYDLNGNVLIDKFGNELSLRNSNDSIRVTLSSPLNRVNIRRNNTDYINIDSGNISDYTPTVDQTYDGTSTNAQSGVAIEDELTTHYQSKLVSGTNIKTINNTSLLGSGNIDVSGGALIDDTTSSATTVYSSQKTQDLIDALVTRIAALEAQINGGNA